MRRQRMRLGCINQPTKQQYEKMGVSPPVHALSTLSVLLLLLLLDPFWKYYHELGCWGGLCSFHALLLLLLLLLPLNSHFVMLMLPSSLCATQVMPDFL